MHLTPASSSAGFLESASDLGFSRLLLAQDKGKRELEYRVPRLRYPVNSQRLSEIYVTRNQ